MPVYGYNVISNHEFKILENEIYNYMINSGVVTEALFTKKQLQDPNTLTKLLEKAEKEKKVKNVVDIIFFGLTILESIAVGILTKHASIGLISWIPFVALTFKITQKLDAVMYETQKKRIKQLREKCQKIIDKYNKIDDPKAKEIVANCKKTIDAIDKYYKKEADAERKKAIDGYTYLYNDLVKIINGKSDFETPDDGVESYALATILGIDLKLIDVGLKKGEVDKSYTLWDVWFGDDDLEYIKKDFGMETIEIMSKYVPEFKNNKPVNIFYAIDDTIFFYSKMANKFYWGDYWYANDMRYGGEKSIQEDLYTSLVDEVVLKPGTWANINIKIS